MLYTIILRNQLVYSPKKMIRHQVTVSSCFQSSSSKGLNFAFEFSVFFKAQECAEMFLNTFYILNSFNTN